MSLLQLIEAVEVAWGKFLSGPLNVYQRMEFLRYHMERHQRQIEHIKKDYRG
jgi:hypothetical protein